MQDQVNHPQIISINISQGGIPKLPVISTEVKFSGLAGDGHNHQKHYRPEQAVSLQDIEKLDELREEGYQLYAGATGENLTVKNLNVNDLPLGTVLKFSSGLALEISKIRKPCYVLDAIDPKLKEDIIGRCGMYARVIEEGAIEAEDFIEVAKPTSVNPAHSTKSVS